MARYHNIFLTFFISGAVYCLTIQAAGFTVQQSCGAFKYFCAQVLGFILEDGAQAMYRSVRGLARRFPEAATTVGSARRVHLGGAVPDMVHAGIYVSHVGRL